jgi:peptide/nickel transport system substrate-binding protein
VSVTAPPPLRRLLPTGAAVLVGALLATGCTGQSQDPPTGAEKGQLSVLSLGPVTTWDPQRISTPQDAAFAGRVFTRTLTAYPAADGSSGTAPDVVGDLATDAGTADKSLSVWSFTLRDGVSWQDGSPVTCEDVRYGVSRSFAEPFATEGLNYPQAYLDIPRKADGTSTYAGPFGGSSKAAQAAFDKAVSCDGQRITFTLTTPVPDFDKIVAVPAFAPVKRGEDKGKDGPYAVFSTGPYQLKGTWDPNSGGTFVRNPHWDKASDPIRKALPDSIRYIEGTESQTAVQEVVNDDGEHRQAVTFDPAPPAMQQHVLADDKLRARSVNPFGQFVDYLAPNLRSRVMANDKARQAFALATNREGYVTALGGEGAASASYTLIGPPLPGHRDTDILRAGPTGDAEAATALLRESGLTLPVKVRVAYRSTPIADKAMAALANGWTEAGFDVELQPVTKDYFTTISQPEEAAKSDVFWANWAPSWPSAATMIRPLFDSRINLVDGSNGRDFGGFDDKRVNDEMNRLSTLREDDARAMGWADLDAALARRAVFIALAQHRELYIAGSGVTGLAANESLGGFVDLAALGVK